MRIDDALGGNHFSEVITNEAQLREIVGRPNRIFTSKINTRLDKACRRFISQSPFVVIGSAGALGQVDVSPKGRCAGLRPPS